MAFCNESDAKTKVKLYISWKIKDIVRSRCYFGSSLNPWVWVLGGDEWLRKRRRKMREREKKRKEKKRKEIYIYIYIFFKQKRKIYFIM